MKWPGFCAASYTSQSILTDYEECINWFPENTESPYAKSQVALYPTPGFQVVNNPGVGLGRAIEQINNLVLAVMGDQIGRIDADGSFTPYGTVGNDGGPAQIAFNGTIGNQALVSSAGNAYAVDLATGVVTPVLEFAANSITQVGMLDGFGIAFGNGRMWVSAINDMTSWDPTQFLQRFDAPDNWVAMYVMPPDIWMIGQQTGSVLYDAGNFPLSFAPRPGLNFKWGTPAPFTVKGSGYSVLWLSENRDGWGIVVRTRGYAPVRVSTYAVEHEINQYQTGSDALAFIYQMDGHTFYVLTFPTEQKTWVYDLDLNYWHKCGLWNAAASRYEAWFPRYHVRSFNKHLVLDGQSSAISEMSPTFALEANGTPIRRLRRAPGIFAERRNLPIQSIDVYLESGTSNPRPPGDDAVLMFRSSDDGGRTWPVERQEPIGRIGQYSAMARLWGLGTPRDRVHELIVSDPITSWRITDAFINNHAPGGGGGAGA